MAAVIQDHWNRGYRISNIEHTLGKWMCLFSKSNEQKAQGFETSPTVKGLKKVFKERQNKGYKLIDLAEGW
jgi:hypothetical protein